MLKQGHCISLAVALPLQPLIAQAPPPKQVYQTQLDRAQATLRSGKLKEARALFDQWLKDHPNDVDALVGAGFTALRQERVGDALKCFNAVVAMTPNYVDAHLGIGLCLLRQEKGDAAKAKIRKAMSMDRKRKDIAEALAEALVRYPDGPTTIVKFTATPILESTHTDLAGLRLLPDTVALPLTASLSAVTPPPASTVLSAEVHAELLAKARKARLDGNMPVSISAYLELLKLAPNDDTVLFELAQTHAWAGHYPEALNRFQSLREQFPDRAREADLRMAQVAAWAGQHDKASTILAPYVAKEDTEATLADITYRAWAGNLRECIARLSRWLEDHPQDAGSRLLRGRLYIWSGRFEDAGLDLRKVLEIDPANPEARIGLARLSLWAGAPQKAQDTLDQLTPEGKALPEAQVLLATVLRTLGRTREAWDAVSPHVNRGPARKDARDLAMAMRDSFGPWAEFMHARLDTSENLRVEDNIIQGRIPFKDGELHMVGGRHDVQTTYQHTCYGLAGLNWSSPIGPKYQASLGYSLASEFGGSPASSYNASFRAWLAPGLDGAITLSRSLIDLTPTSSFLRGSWISRDGYLGYRFGQDRHRMDFNLGSAALSAGSTRNSYNFTYQFRIPFTEGEFRTGYLSKGIFFTQTLPLGFYNPERYTWNGSISGLEIRRAEQFKIALDVRAGFAAATGQDTKFSWSAAVLAEWRPLTAPLFIQAGFTQVASAVPLLGISSPTEYREHTFVFRIRLMKPLPNQGKP